MTERGTVFFGFCGRWRFGWQCAFLVRFQKGGFASTEAMMSIVSAGGAKRDKQQRPSVSTPLQPRSEKLMRVTILSHERMSFFGYSIWTHFSEGPVRLQRS